MALAGSRHRGWKWSGGPAAGREGTSGRLDPLLAKPRIFSREYSGAHFATWCSLGVSGPDFWIRLFIGAGQRLTHLSWPRNLAVLIPASLLAPPSPTRAQRCEPNARNWPRADHVRPRWRRPMARAQVPSLATRPQNQPSRRIEHNPGYASRPRGFPLSVVLVGGYKTFGPCGGEFTMAV